MRQSGEGAPYPSGSFIYGGPERGLDGVTHGPNGAIALDERDGGIVKFHVGDPGPTRRADLIKELMPTLQRLGLEYKVMSNSSSDSPSLSASQKGKFVTVYPPSIENAAYVERELGAAMNRFARRHEAGGLGYVSPPFDYATPYPGLHWRYGGFQSDDVSGPTQRRGAQATRIQDVRDATSVGMLKQRLDSEINALRNMQTTAGHSDAAIRAKSERVGALDNWARRALQNHGGSPSIDPPTVRRPTIRPGESDAERQKRVQETIGASQSQHWTKVVAGQTRAVMSKDPHYSDVMNRAALAGGAPALTRAGPSLS